ncbi:ATP-dependent nuclease [Tenacibaculum halocynthiae]|uniref:ATP-dependent nuclease n=1 Tax=Tenacibaculum halocynthiae TaxID=1254437 RepID=UPI0038960303
MKYRIDEFNIKNFRSISQIKIRPNKDENLLTICGSNNVGKTNFLRALYLFFHPIKENFSAKKDIPYHISEGSMGLGFVTTLKAKITEISTGKTYNITQKFTERKGEKQVDILGKIDRENLTQKEVIDFLNKNFKFFLIEASNVNIPKLVSEIVNEEILPIGLDKRRGKAQQESLEKLTEFIDKSKEAVGKIENEITKIFKDILKDVNTIDSDDWKLKINFPEYNYLREAISNMINFTLFDTNQRELETKGSGIQRTILLSLIQYVNKKTKKDVIWAIDEPEAFLQADLQKSLFNRLKDEATRNKIIVTTHSHFFIDLNSLKNTFLFAGTKELKEYSRKPGLVFHKLNTIVINGSDYEKATNIKKHFGIKRNDSWEIFPYNIVVEGQEDKDLFIALFNKFDLPIPNVLVAGGVDKYKGYLQFIEDMCSELSFKPKLKIIFDKDGAGKSQYNTLKNKTFKNFTTECLFIIRFDGKTYDNIELEDFIYPDLIFNATNKLLRKKGYKSIRKSDREKRCLASYDRKPILECLNDFTTQNNEDKHPMDFNTMSSKLFLSDKICKEISTTDLTEQMKNFPKVEEFLTQIASG